MRLFDPGFRAFWEGDTVDMGNDPMTLINMCVPMCQLGLQLC